MPRPSDNCAIDFLLRLLPRGGNSAPAGAGNDQSAPINPRCPNHALRFFLIVGRISRNWGPLGCWTALSYFVIKTGHGANMFRILSNRLAEGSFLVRLLGYLFWWFGCKTGPIDRVADTIEHVGTFFRHAGAAFKSGRDVVTKISNISADVSDENNNTASSNGDSRESITDVATEVDFARSDNDREQQAFSSEQEVKQSARAVVESRIISSMEEGEEIIAKWKEGSGGFILDVPLDMSAHIAKDLMSRFIDMGAACLIQGPNLKSILEKELASAESDLEVATKNVAGLKYLIRPPSSTDRKTES